MRRLLLRLLGLAGLAAMTLPPLAAGYVRSRGDRPTVADFEPFADEIDLAAIFEGFELRSQAPAFRGGDLLLWYGGGVLDLRGATLDPAGGKLVVRSMFGGMQLIVPEDWPIRVRSRGFLGGVASELPSAPEAAGALVIDALSAFGGIGITTHSPKDEAPARIEKPARLAADEGAPDADAQAAGA